ncbi:MAG: hypothetical protein ACRDD8_10830 [Bacteroidales bacterium]
MKGSKKRCGARDPQHVIRRWKTLRIKRDPQSILNVPTTSNVTFDGPFKDALAENRHLELSASASPRETGKNQIISDNLRSTKKMIIKECCKWSKREGIACLCHLKRVHRPCTMFDNMEHLVKKTHMDRKISSEKRNDTSAKNDLPKAVMEVNSSLTVTGRELPPREEGVITFVRQQRLDFCESSQVKLDRDHEISVVKSLPKKEGKPNYIYGVQKTDFGHVIRDYLSGKRSNMNEFILVNINTGKDLYRKKHIKNMLIGVGKFQPKDIGTIVSISRKNHVGLLKRQSLIEYAKTVGNGKRLELMPWTKNLLVKNLHIAAVVAILSKNSRYSPPQVKRAGNELLEYLMAPECIENNEVCTFVYSTKEKSQFIRLIGDIRNRLNTDWRKPKNSYLRTKNEYPMDKRDILKALEVFLKEGTGDTSPEPRKGGKPRPQPGKASHKKPDKSKGKKDKQAAKLVAYLSNEEKGAERHLICSISTSRQLLRPSLVKTAAQEILNIRIGALSGLISVRDREWVGFIREDDYEAHKRTKEFGDPRIQVRAWNRETFMRRIATAAALAYACGFGTSALAKDKERARKLFYLLDSSNMEDAANLVCIHEQSETPPYQQGMSGYV